MEYNITPTDTQSSYRTNTEEHHNASTK